MLACFDVDGVLVEVSESYFRAMAETVSSYIRRPVSRELLLNLKFSLNLNNDWDATLAGILFYLSRKNFEEFVEEMLPGPPDFRKFYAGAEARGISLPDYRELVEKFESYYRQFRDSETLNITPAALEEIKKLARVMAVITGRTREDLAYTFEKFSLYRYFDHLITEDDLPEIGARKPSAFPLKLLFERCGQVHPAFYVGDTLADRQMVENFNREYKQSVFFILFRNASNRGLKADFYAGNEKELLQAIKIIFSEHKFI